MRYMMEANNTTTRRLLAYLNNELSPEERQQLEIRLEQEPGLQVELGEISLMRDREKDPAAHLEKHRTLVHAAMTAAEARQLLAWQEVPALRGTDSQQRLDAALQEGADADWKQAAATLAAIVTDLPADSEARLYYGRALCMAGQTPAGIAQFHQLIDDEQYLPATRLEARWFRALAYLAVANCDSAREDLRILSDQAGTQRKTQAEAFLKGCL
jgi:anti-sigma factor RsiW